MAGGYSDLTRAERRQRVATMSLMSQASGRMAVPDICRKCAGWDGCKGEFAAGCQQDADDRDRRDTEMAALRS